MSAISSIPLPTPIHWSSKKTAADKHILQLNELFSPTSSLVHFYIKALVEVSIEELRPRRKDIASYWFNVLNSNQPVAGLVTFFQDWLVYTPTPADPGKYIEIWDYLVNTKAGLLMANAPVFKPWFTQFLNDHGDWINSYESVTEHEITMKEWMHYPGTREHPFDIKDYQVPDGGFQSFNQFFLRNLKPDERPMCDKAQLPSTIVAPCDGGVFYLNKEGDSNSHNCSGGKGFLLPGKSGDRFDLIDALPGYGEQFVGGPLLDILLWFTDYHHFHAPVSGKIISHGLYQGSYNYDFDNYNPLDPFGPLAPPDSDRVGWYQNLGKHQRYVWIFETEDLGLVAMIAIGFWGVGSIVPTGVIDNETYFEKGQYMGHFGYGGSSIVLAFEPNIGFEFEVGDQPVEDPDNPVLMKVRECLGKKTG